MLPLYRDQSIDLLVVLKGLPFDASQANQLTGFYMRATLVFNGLSSCTFCFLNSPLVTVYSVFIFSATSAPLFPLYVQSVHIARRV